MGIPHGRTGTGPDYLPRLPRCGDRGRGQRRRGAPTAALLPRLPARRTGASAAALVAEPRPHPGPPAQPPPPLDAAAVAETTQSAVADQPRDHRPLLGRACALGR